MRAATYPRYGSPDVIVVRDIGRPSIGSDDVLVRVHAASVNPLDWHMLRGTPRFLRLTEGLLRPKHPVLGADVAGVVVEAGSGVTDLAIGDEVFGEIGHGAIAEFARCPASCVARKPAGVSWEAAAATPVAALTALQGLRDIGHIRGGMNVLVNGASGGVGVFAVQIAKSHGANVTGVCSTRNLDLVRQAGADHAIDYTQADFTRGDARYDLIFDAVGNRRVSELKRVLTPTGACALMGFDTMGRLFANLIAARFATRSGGRSFGNLTAHPNRADLEIIASLLDAGALRPFIDRRYTLDQTADAIRYLETRRARGKVVINVESTA
ncbi:MAG: NAD(P)-dependent alcohol dehydrogenase [Spirochaetaceae bacterium]|nr:MAG: NAD(P)-dependent alcohol dehydrogenase [Spirochaetaceae bacterium]